MKRSPLIAIEISPTRLEVARLRARRAVTLREKRLRADPDAGWAAHLDAVGHTLREWVDELALAGSRAVVLYESPAAQASLFSCPLSAGRAGARRAGELAVAERSSLPPEECATSTVDLCTDPAPRGGGDPPRRHLLVVADALANVGLLADVVRGASLEFACAIPADAPLIARTVSEALDRSRSRPSLVVHLAEHSTILAAATEGRLLFARRAALGAESFVDALIDVPIPAREGESSVIDAARARELLAGAGVPGPDEEFDAERGIRGAGVLPLIRPALQRCVMEVRQSIRFGFEGVDRESIELSVGGQAARIPRLGAAIAQECSLTLAAPEPREDARHAGDAETGPLGAYAAWAGAPRDRLAPPEIIRGRALNRVRNAMWTGAAAALALVAFDGALSRASLHAVRDRIDTLERELEASDAASETARTLRTREAGLRHAERRIAQEFTMAPDAAITLAAVSRALPESVRLSDITLTTRAKGTVILVRGHVRSADPDEGARAIRGCLDAIGSLPIVESCRLGSSRRADAGDARATYFDLVADLRPPSLHALPALSSVIFEDPEGVP